MWKKRIIVFVVFVCPIVCKCQNIRQDLIFGATTLCSQQGITSIEKNISGLPILGNSKWIVGIHQTYCIPELWNVSVSYASKIKKRGSLPVTISCHGPGNFLNIRLKTGYSQAFSKHFSAGIRLLSEYYFINGSTNMFTVGFDAGALYAINNKASIGLVCSMPNLIHNTSESMWKNIQIETAFSYYLFDKANINFGIRNSQYTNIEFIASVSSVLTKHTFLFLAYSSGNNQISTGVTIALKNINIAVLAEINFRIGVSPEIQIAF